MNDQHGHDIEDLAVGMSASYAKTITEADIVLFAGVSGDNNAVHTNEEFAATTEIYTIAYTLSLHDALPIW